MPNSLWPNILFDLDGTLSDSAPGILACVRHALAHFGIKEPDDEKLRGFLGPPLDESFRVFYGFSEEDAAAAVALYRERYRPTGIFETEIYPGIPALLQGLQNAGRQLFLATSKPEVFARQILDKFGLSAYFTAAAGVPLQLTKYSKGDVIRTVMGQHALAPESCVMVGDRLHDVAGAHENGIACIGVLYGYGSREELHKAGADFIVQDVPALQKLLIGE